MCAKLECEGGHVNHDPHLRRTANGTSADFAKAIHMSGPFESPRAVWFELAYDLSPAYQAPIRCTLKTTAGCNSNAGAQIKPLPINRNQSLGGP